MSRLPFVAATIWLASSGA
uniref:Uncharacterized protein n=1 Tax=Arundo donax TaxID=35708 RepID=A0A0A9EAR4_ARUDO